MKRRRWPRIVAAIGVVLVAGILGGVISAFTSSDGDERPITWLTPLIIVLPGVALVVILPPLFRPATVGVTELPDGIQFTISPVIPFAKALEDARRALGHESRTPGFGSFSRPLVATNSGGIRIWKAARDAQPLVTIPAAAVRSITSAEQRVQVSRVGVTAKFICITVELLIGTSEIRLILPACTEVNQVNPAPREFVDAWADQMRETLRA